MTDRATDDRKEARVTELVCAHCGRDIAWCSFCDEVDCPDPSCYPCIVSALHQWIEPLHEHGG